MYMFLQMFQSHTSNSGLKLGLVGVSGTQSKDYQAFLAEGSGNVAADGYFNVSVLIECLRRKRIHCICQRNVGEHEEAGVDFGYILNHADHWLALRRVHGTWCAGPHHNSESKILNYVLQRAGKTC